MGVRYYDAKNFGAEILCDDSEGTLKWVERKTGRVTANAWYSVVGEYAVTHPDLHEVFPAWAPDVHLQPSEEKDLSDVNIIREALDGQRGEHQKLIAEYGVEVVATLIRKNSDYGGSAWQHPCLLQKLSGREGIQVRMSDKVQRLQKLLNGDTAQVAESIEDTMKDLVGYTMLWLAAPEEAR